MNSTLTLTERKNHLNATFSLQREGLVCLLIVIATLTVYWQVQNFDFVNFDDDQYVAENFHVQEGLTLKSIHWAFTAMHASNWHPVTWLSHILDCQLYGLNPGRHHLTNLLIHIANSLLLFCVFIKMTRCVWQSAFVAALFALHPLHVESVAWISERKDVLSTFFWMLTMWSYVRYVERPKLSQYLWVVFFFILGLMSKPMLVTLPFVLLLLDYWPLNRLQVDPSGTVDSPQQRSIALRLGWEKVPLFILVAVSSTMTFYAQKHGKALASLDALALKTRIANALVAYLKYIEKMLYPAKQAVLYPYPAILPWWQVVGAFLLFLSISYVAIRLIRQRPYFVVGWLWYVGTLVPVIGLIQVGNQAMADRYTYVPFIGLFVIVAWGVPALWAHRKHSKKWFTALATVTLAFLMAVTWKQVGCWRNSITLFEHTLKNTTQNYRAHNNLGLALVAQNRIEEAIDHYLQALRIRSSFEKAHNNLGLALVALGRIDQAIEHYLQALRIKSDYFEVHVNLGVALGHQDRTKEAVGHFLQALRIKPDDVGAHNNLGFALARQGRTDEAIEHYLQALRIKPNYLKAIYNLGAAMYKQGRTEEAVGYLLQAVQINPESAEAHYNLGLVLDRVGRTEEAIEHFVKTLRINPGFEKAHNILGNALLKQGKANKAIKHFSDALRLNPQLVDTYNSLGTALIHTGRVAEAIIHFRKALQIDPDNTEALKNLNKTLATLEEIDREIENIQEKLTLTPEDPMLNYNSGNLYRMKGQLDKAQVYYAKAVSLRSEFPEAIYQLAKLHVGRSEYEKALSLYQKMLTFLPDNPAVYYNVACIYARWNKPEESVSWLQKAVARGFDDWKHIKTDVDLDNIRNSLEYKEFAKGH